MNACTLKTSPPQLQCWAQNQIPTCEISSWETMGPESPKQKDETLQHWNWGEGARGRFTVYFVFTCEMYSDNSTHFYFNFWILIAWTPSKFSGLLGMILFNGGLRTGVAICAHTDYECYSSPLRNFLLLGERGEWMLHCVICFYLRNLLRQRYRFDLQFLTPNARSRVETDEEGGQVPRNACQGALTCFHVFVLPAKTSFLTSHPNAAWLHAEKQSSDA